MLKVRDWNDIEDIQYHVHLPELKVTVHWIWIKALLAY